jgi:Domain of unknown function (DUF4389)
MNAEMSSTESREYPVRMDVRRPESQSRLTNFPLFIGSMIRAILLIPHLIVVGFLGIIAGLVFLVATIAILFSGKYPLGMFNFYVGYTRWTANVYAYLGHLYDAYPPFSTEQQAYPLTFEVDYPEKSSRILNFPIFGLYLKELLLIPHFIVLAFLITVAFIVIFIAQFAILFTGSFPEGMHGFVVGVGRWAMRVNGYVYALTDKYPPFSLS